MKLRKPRKTKARLKARQDRYESAKDKQGRKRPDSQNHKKSNR